MPVPQASSFPTDLDTNENLYEVRDGLRVRLSEDYTPGDTSIIVVGDVNVIARFPDSGLITLTEQCSDIDERALSFHYASRSPSSFDDLTLLPDQVDIVKPKRLTNVTQNVMDSHHNNLKDAIIAIEEFIGIKGTVDARPFGDTLEGRINFMHKVALRPRAWFTVNKRVGIVPMEVEFKDLSFRTATGCPVGTIIYEWNFGDQTVSTISLSVISATSQVPSSSSVNVLVQDLDGGTIRKVYDEPGLYDVVLTVTDDKGTDTVIFPQLINARIAAPTAATINFVPTTDQEYDAFNDVLRTPTDSLIHVEVPLGIDPGTSDPDRSYAGEELNISGYPLDPIVEYTWLISDDLPHGNSPTTSASFALGGLYDLVLRVDTQFNSFRITNKEDNIDAVEKSNLWLWTIPDPLSPNEAQTYEFGLLSQTFKVKTNTTLTVTRNDDFLDGTNGEERAKSEFDRNVGFAPLSTTGSHSKSSTALLYWSGGRDAGDLATTEEINKTEFNGFLDTYDSATSISRPWNWMSWNSPSNVYFLYGNITGTIPPNDSPTNPEVQALSKTTMAVTSTVLTNSSYRNGAEELTRNSAKYDLGSIPDDGYFAVFRSTWQDSTGYLIRNSNTGALFKLSDFYITEGTAISEFETIRKMPDMAGPVKVEGQLVGLSRGAYFFNNTGAISAFNISSGTWETGGPGVNASSFRSLQDTSLIGFDEHDNTLLAVSDNDHRAYLSYDYSEKAFIKFDQTTLTFTTLGSRPSGEQWNMGVY